MRIELAPPHIVRPTASVCPGCKEVATAPGRVTHVPLVLDDLGRPWHAGCALSALAEVSLDEED